MSDPTPQDVLERLLSLERATDGNYVMPHYLISNELRCDAIALIERMHARAPHIDDSLCRLAEIRITELEAQVERQVREISRLEQNVEVWNRHYQTAVEQIERDSVDAERYRYLRNIAVESSPINVIIYRESDDPDFTDVHIIGRDELDVTVDAAIRETKP
jgi:hypothetical protein